VQEQFPQAVLCVALANLRHIAIETVTNVLMKDGSCSLMIVNTPQDKACAAATSSILLQTPHNACPA
jgi:hypothetical protein